MSDYGKASDFEIASLKKKEAGSYNLMLPGHGTPWEDRGASGIVSAFFKTCFQSLFAHRSMLDQIRRPETTSEATGFALVCSAIWGISIGIWDAYGYYTYSGNSHFNVDASQYAMEACLRMVVTFLGAYLLLRLAAQFFGQLVASSSDHQVPPVLTYNVFAYSMGPSIIAIVPVIGWAVAFIWIIADMAIGARTRLYVKMREVVANLIIVWLLLIGLSIGVYFGLGFLWNHVLMDPSVTPITGPNLVPHPVG